MSQTKSSILTRAQLAAIELRHEQGIPNSRTRSTAAWMGTAHADREALIEQVRELETALRQVSDMVPWPASRSSVVTRAKELLGHA